MRGGSGGAGIAAPPAVAAVSRCNEVLFWEGCGRESIERGGEFGRASWHFPLSGGVFGKLGGMGNNLLTGIATHISPRRRWVWHSGRVVVAFRSAKERPFAERKATTPAPAPK